MRAEISSTTCKGKIKGEKNCRYTSSQGGRVKIVSQRRGALPGELGYGSLGEMFRNQRVLSLLKEKGEVIGGGNFKEGRATFLDGELGGEDKGGGVKNAMGKRLGFFLGEK